MKRSLLLLLVAAMVFSCHGMLFVSAEEGTAEKIAIESYEIVSGDKSTADSPYNGDLIDGQIGSGATADLESGLWNAFETGKNLQVDGDSQWAYIVVDLGAEYLVSEIRFNHLGTHPAGISTPWGLMAETSFDNVNWIGVSGYANTDDNGDPVWSSTEGAYWTALAFSAPVAARYVKFRIATLAAATKIYLSELEVYGTLNDNAVELPEADPSSPLYQKSVLFVGDSLCEGWIEWNDPTYSKMIGYAGRIMVGNEMTGSNKSKSGASMSTCRGENTVIAQLQAMAGNSYDYLILEGGANDAWDACAVGTMTEGFDGPFDVTTFAGGMEATIQYAKENFPNAIFGYTTNFTMPMATHGKLADMSEYIDMAIAICEKWNIPYLDLYNDEDLNKDVLKTDTTECLYDYIHLNSNGFNVLTPIIEDWMKTLTVDGIPSEESSEAESSEETASSEAESIAQSAEESSAEEPESGIPVYVYVIIAVAAVAVIAVVAVLVLKKKK